MRKPFVKTVLANFGTKRVAFEYFLTPKSSRLPQNSGLARCWSVCRFLVLLRQAVRKPFVKTVLATFGTKRVAFEYFLTPKSSRLPQNSCLARFKSVPGVLVPLRQTVGKPFVRTVHATFG